MVERDADTPGALRDGHLQLHARLIQRHHARLCGLPELAVSSRIPEVRVGIKLVHVLDQRAFRLWGKRGAFHGRFLSFPQINQDRGTRAEGVYHTLLVGLQKRRGTACLSAPPCYRSCTEPSYPSGVSSTLSTGGYLPIASSRSSIPRPRPSGTVR